ncbi:MAG: hypothetical protein MI892_17055 [Desulfobacterales bacterium]|nr:hypothetical protein [Desulfobacterales bacterium]
MTVKATLVHQMDGRLRFRFKGILKDRSGFFERLVKQLNDAFAYATIRVNPVTGSLVLQDPRVDLDAVVGFARDTQLFELVRQAPSTGYPVTCYPVTYNPVVYHARRYVKSLENGIHRLTGGRLDMGSSVFLTLLIHAMREIAKGNLKTPSWFTALWIASNIYMKDFNGTGEGHDDFG